MERITGTDAANLMEAYAQVYAPQEEVELTEEQVQEDFENWVNSLVEEGHDLSEYTWEDMYEVYLNEDLIGDLRANAGRAVRAVTSAAGAANRAAGSTNQAIGRAASSVNQAMVNRIKQNVPQGSFPGTRPTISAKPAPAAQGSQYNMKNLGAAQYAAFKGGGGDAAIKQGYSAGEVVARGRAAINRADGGPRNVGAERAAQIKGSPVVGPRTVAPARPPVSQRPATAPTPSYAGAQGVKPVGTSVAGSFKPVAGAPSQNSTFSAPATPAKRPSLASQAAELRAMQAASRQRQGLTQGFDIFDVIKGHLLDEGYADSEEAALTIMANMSEEWKQSICESLIGDFEAKKRQQSGYTGPAPSIKTSPGYRSPIETRNDIKPEMRHLFLQAKSKSSNGSQTA